MNADADADARGVSDADEASDGGDADGASGGDAGGRDDTPAGDDAAGGQSGAGGRSTAAARDPAEDPALGAPEKMAAVDELTPMLSQYYDLCAEYDDSLVLFQVGDFYETFCEAAEASARILEITLTKREDSTGEYPMAGIPIDNAESYIETLLDAGYRVAVADQVEDPEETTGVVERAVTRVVTPGTLTEDELLRTDDNNYVAALTGAPEGYGLAMLDVSTGDFYATSVDSSAALRDELDRFGPAEAVVEPGVDGEVLPPDCMVTPFRTSAFDADAARERVTDYFGRPETVLSTGAETRACGALLAYAEYTRGGEGKLGYLNHLRRYDPREYMLLDRVALRSLELFERRAVDDRKTATLVDVVDETRSALGRRRLTDWLRRPLLAEDDIEARLDAVEELVGGVRTRNRLRERLHDVYDVERLLTRVSRARADARDLRALEDTLDVVPALREALADAEADSLRSLREELDELADVRERIGSAIREEPPTEITEGGVIREGYDETLDDLRETEREGKQWIADLEAQERERTGIDSLKVGHNAVHGYYIEVTNPNLDSVPDEYRRRQTLKNAERFVTPELKEREEEILNAEGRADDLEYELFVETRSAVAEEAERIQAVADAVARLDALAGLAAVAAEHDYARPAFSEDTFDISGGRHPVVERTEESFVPNDTHIDDASRLSVITGPNMSGKSTYMRQVALISVLAQAGSFVPAADATLPIVDQVFTRVGASDDIAGGRSTFMVEMTEVATILREATEDSLVVLDEVGRGTSTADGFAIARAVTEFLHDEVGATTLFATHHHDLTAVAESLPRARNLHFSAAQADGDGGVTFDHAVAPGAAGASYGIEVARSAGVPEAVVERARAVVEERPDAGEDETSDADAEAATGNAARSREPNDVPPEVVETLQSLSVAETTPVEALTELNRLKRLVEESDSG